MTDINLSLIQTFYHLGRTGTYSGAGQVLGLSHPAVANQIRRLERIIGEPLVEAEQGARRLRFTSRGQQLYALIRPELDVMLSRLDTVLQKQRPVLRMGMSQGSFHHLMARVMRPFRDLHPDVGVVVYERDTALADLVRQGSIDIFLADRHFGDPLVEQQLLGHYRLCLARPAGWHESPGSAAGAVQEWAATRPFVTFEPGQTLRDIATDYLSRGSIGIEPVISTSSSANVVRCVADGLGFAILPQWCIDPGDSRIAVSELPDLSPVAVYFGTSRIRHGAPILADLYRLCHAEFAQTLTGSA